MGAYLDALCPWYLHYGMTWDAFWNGPIEALPAYWQKYQFDIEARNQELWMQGLYIRSAIVSSFDTTKPYPDSPHRVTERTPEEQTAEDQRKLAILREQLDEQARRFKARKETRP